MKEDDPINHDVAPAYIRGNFEPEDRLALVIINRRTNAVLQRLSDAEKIAGLEIQAWLRNLNQGGSDVYLSMNTLRETAHGRTKAEIAHIRHIYLDFDDNGTAAVQRLCVRSDMPPPNYVLNTSPDKWQITWKVDGFEKADAETLQKGLAKELGADPAATDCARVMRLPGFYNHKYSEPYLVQVEAHSSIIDEIYRPKDFPDFPKSPINRGEGFVRSHSKHTGSQLSQSEHDWAYAKRALARGEPEDVVIAAIATFRRHDKHSPERYAELTVRKARESLNAKNNAIPLSHADPTLDR